MKSNWLIGLVALTCLFSGSYLVWKSIDNINKVQAESKSVPVKGPTLEELQRKQPGDGVEPLKIDPSKFQHREISIYYVPHPDDEILTFGVPIRNDIQSGRVVFLILLSHGESTGAIDKVSRLAKKKLTPKQIGEARVLEFRDAARSLGVEEPFYHIYNMPGGKYQHDVIQNIALYFEHNFPSVIHNTMSEEDVLSDHHIPAKVIGALQKEGKVKQFQTYSSVYMDRISKKKRDGYKVYLISPHDKESLDQAIHAYKIWNPTTGRYAIGNHSVSDQFRALQQDYYARRSPN
ncbi:PIG-L family deacetylase [Risungbinella massiliensis]|uniref:PIG-L family deacetylase n=1 Tax=Risungbinella massiliensis TaxID=1329796 RepID=UPI0005CC8560|nr:PIG-L family deacetylase [Risungbinella massiliensis]